MARRRSDKPRFDLDGFSAEIGARRAARGLSWAATLREINQPFADVANHRPIAVGTVAGLEKGKRIIEGDSALQVCIWLGEPPERFVPGHFVGDEHALPVLPSDRILRWDLRRLHQAIDHRRRESDLSWTTLAASLDTTPGVLRHLRAGGRSTLPALMDWILWLERPAVEFTHASSR